MRCPPVRACPRRHPIPVPLAPQPFAVPNYLRELPSSRLLLRPARQDFDVNVASLYQSLDMRFGHK